MLRSALAVMALSMSLVACGVGQEEVAPGSAEHVDTQAQNMCEPGPSSNWCQNVAGTACTAPGNRRCYIPNYCEWSFCRCIEGAWQCS
ncbi:hypothetical protein [Corallococcus macrosporus]|uniref:Lipoprotein n=2 Tax=Myxococcaceae TaxID=31 RepID=A0A250JX09_9BACT|nr:hypothetical protein [Corallococcus macrosporus]AEI67418.1 hypothetical protein LILAB_27655 [Corallococcus macrosporus]ATB48198.1 hypothetical protein MYMAC_003824 [Corallococcus macrosporus DSM 14697]